MAFDKVQDFSSSTGDVLAWGWYDDRDLIFGGSGDDTISAGRGSDEVHGGRGDDFIMDQTYNFAVWLPPSVFFPFGEAEDLSRLELAHQEDNFISADMDGVVKVHPWGVVTWYESGDDTFFGDEGDDRL